MSNAQRYHIRSPRYVLQAQDERILRYAAMETRGESSVTKMLNLSESGLAFEVHRDDAPSEGDVLKIEFEVPDHSKIACFATVVRVERKNASPSDQGTTNQEDNMTAEQLDEESSDWQPLFAAGHVAQDMIHLVGLQFRNLPSSYRRLLSQSLKERAHSEVIIDWKSFRRKQLASFAGISLATVVILFILAVPCESWLSALKSWF